jgi:hypothetical protein
MSDLKSLPFFLEPIKTNVTQVLGVEQYAEIGDASKLMIFRIKDGFEEHAELLGGDLQAAFPENTVVVLPHFVDMVRLWPVTEESAEAIE